MFAFDLDDPRRVCRFYQVSDLHGRLQVNNLARQMILRGTLGVYLAIIGKVIRCRTEVILLISNYQATIENWGHFVLRRTGGGEMISYVVKN